MDRFVDTLEKFERGDLAPDAWRAFRLVHGVYGQRQEGPMMVRVKIPQGVLTVGQLLALGDVAENWSTGKGHVTTRQNVQFHFVKMDDVETVLRKLADEGMTTREACGNSVRNITACPYAGVSATEAFDVTPYGEALTRHLLRGPLSSSLPRTREIDILMRQLIRSATSIGANYREANRGVSRADFANKIGIIQKEAAET